RGIAARDRRGFLFGIDAAREDGLQVLVDPRTAEALLDQRVHREGRQVALVEDDRVAQRDRLVEVGGGVEEIEQRARAATRAAESIERLAAIEHGGGQRLRSHPPRVQFSEPTAVRITLNGDPYDLEQPLSVQELLERLDIDPRRVAVEHNLVIVRRTAFAAT